MSPSKVGTSSLGNLTLLVSEDDGTGASERRRFQGNNESRQPGGDSLQMSETGESINLLNWNESSVKAFLRTTSSSMRSTIV